MTRVSDWCFHGQCDRCTSPFCLHRCAENSCFERVLGSERETMGAQEKTAPGGALTPESQGLADWIGVD